jgi:DNA-binding HxlR family transcriptional regulator
MREATAKAIREYSKAWQTSLKPEALSFVQMVVAFSNGQALFSELVEKTGISSRTLNKWLKKGIKQGLISKQPQRTFPRKTVYSLTQKAKLFKSVGGYIRSIDMTYRVLIKRAGEGYDTPKEIVEKAIKHRKVCLDLFFRIDPSWLKDPFFGYIQLLFSAINAITFWGTFFSLSFPHIKNKAKVIMVEKGILPFLP